MVTDGQIFKTFVENGRIRPIGLYSAMGISRQAFYQLYKTKRFEDDTIKSIEKATKTSWDEIKKNNIDKVSTLQFTEQDSNVVEITRSTLENSLQTLVETNSKLVAALLEHQAHLFSSSNTKTKNALPHRQDVEAHPPPEAQSLDRRKKIGGQKDI